MKNKKSKLGLRVSIKDENDNGKNRNYKINIIKSYNISQLFEQGISLKLKENIIDKIVKFSALAAVLLALATVIFDCSQSVDQDKTFASFRNKLDSTFTVQLKNAQEQHSNTISTLEEQKELMKRQNDSTIEILRLQADRLRVQNEIWKINQKNQILTERPKITATPSSYFLKDDSISFVLNYTNSGQRVAFNIDCNIGIFIIDKNQGISLLTTDAKPPFTMNKIAPNSSVFWSVKKTFPKLRNSKEVLFFTNFSYEDEMFYNRFIITDFLRVYNTDSITNYSFCDLELIEFIQNNSHYRDVDIEDFTFKNEFIFK